ncbi:MAG: hypothetical protein ACI4WY_05490 [Anaerovoracaceae bacterium]
MNGFALDKVETLHPEQFDAKSNNYDSAATNIAKLNNCYRSKVSPSGDVYVTGSQHIIDNIRRWADIDMTDRSANLEASILSGNLENQSIRDLMKQMYSGTIDCNGNTTRGLKEVSKMKLHPDYYLQNLNQHAGFSAEIISTAKENLLSKVNNMDVKTFRADDRPDLFQTNDQFVDKIRVDCRGNIIEKIQVKFVGKDANACLSKLASADYDKYFETGSVDKIEIPKDYYDEIRNSKLIEKRIMKLEKQLERVSADNKPDVTANIQKRIERYNKISDMIERSTVTKEEAVYATIHPKRYVSKLFIEENLKISNQEGIKTGLPAACITAAVSTVENCKSVIDGTMSAQEAFSDAALKTGMSGVLGYGTGFISTSISNTMVESSHSLIKSMGKAGIPAMAVTFAIESYDSMIDFATGVIDGKELAFDLSENAVGIAGSVQAAKYGAAAGLTIAGAPGAAVGGMVGGMVGYAITTEAYATVVEVGGEGVHYLIDKAQELASSTYESAKEILPDKAGSIKTAMMEYAAKAGLPISL